MQAGTRGCAAAGQGTTDVAALLQTRTCGMERITSQACVNSSEQCDKSQIAARRLQAGESRARQNSPELHGRGEWETHLSAWCRHKGPSGEGAGAGANTRGDAMWELLQVWRGHTAAHRYCRGETSAGAAQCGGGCCGAPGRGPRRQERRPEPGCGSGPGAAPTGQGGGGSGPAGPDTGPSRPPPFPSGTPSAAGLRPSTFGGAAPAGGCAWSPPRARPRRGPTRGAAPCSAAGALPRGRTGGGAAPPCTPPSLGAPLHPSLHPCPRPSILARTPPCGPPPAPAPAGPFLPGHGGAAALPLRRGGR